MASLPAEMGHLLPAMAEGIWRWPVDVGREYPVLALSKSPLGLWYATFEHHEAGSCCWNPDDCSSYFSTRDPAPRSRSTPVATAAAQTKASAADGDETRVRSLYRKAAAAFGAGKYEDAQVLLLEAWHLRRSYDVAAALGQAELELKRYRDAAEHLQYAVKNFAPVKSEKNLDTFEG